MKKYDYTIVGAGLFGSVFAREMTDRGFKCLVVDKRNHIGGNCYTKKNNNIDMHVYGPHIFHTSNEKIWKYINKFSEFNHFTYRPKVKFKDKIYSFPINLFSLYQIWNVKTPEEAKKKLQEVKIKIDNPSNLEEWVLSEVGEEIYQIFFYGYTKKQWGCDPKNLPTDIIKRLPIRLSMDDNYFNDCYQGIPKNGYTEIFEKMLEGIELKLNIDFLKEKQSFENISSKIIYTGALDEFFNYELGHLDWRSLKFETELLQIDDFQGNAAINFTEENVPYTRTIEHKHFTFVKNETTIITKEYPDKWDLNKEKFYPINNIRNNNLHNEYRKKINFSKYILGGRLADYKYYDMHQVIASAFTKIDKENE